MAQRRINRMKKNGFWDLMLERKEEYLKENPSEKYVYEKYIGVNEKTAKMMVENYKEILRAFDMFFEKGEYMDILYNRYPQTDFRWL